MKIKNYVVAASGVLLVAGCGPREETVVVQEPSTTVVETKEVKKVPVPQDKTIVVQPGANQVSKSSTTKTDVKVNVESPPADDTTSTPAPTPTPKPRPTATPKPRPTATPRANPVSRPKVNPTPRPNPAGTNPKTTTEAPITVRAEIVSASRVPDPKTVAYKDSIVFHKYKVLTVQNGKYSEDEILVAHWGMRNKSLQPAARFRVGDVKTLKLEPFGKFPDLEKIQRNDDTNEYDLSPYWAGG